MMEEVSDDTNGESSFEFVGDRTDESSGKEISLSEIRNVDPSAIQMTSSIAPVLSGPPVQSPVSLKQSPNEQSSISFYNPTDAPSLFAPLPSNPMVQSSSPLSSNPMVQSSPPLSSNPMVQSSPPLFSSNPLVQSSSPPLPGPFSETQSRNPYSKSAAPVSETPVSVLDPSIQHYSLAMPTVEAPPNIQFPESSENSGGVWGWIKGNQLLNKVAERAKNSVDSVITTLDPGMKEIINTGGDINIIVASGNEAKISAVREAFQQVFGKATVQGIAVQSSSIAPQPVGFSAGLKAAEERISNLRQQGCLDSNNVVLAIENFIAELTPDNWFDMGCLLLQDFNSGIILQVYTEAIPVSSLYVAQAKDQTPADYPLGWSGHAVTVGQIIGSALGVHHSEWHQALTGVSRREILLLAAKSIAGLYRMQLRR